MLAVTKQIQMEDRSLTHAKSCIQRGDYYWAKKFFELYIDDFDINDLSDDLSPLREIEIDYFQVLSNLYKVELSSVKNPAFSHFATIFESIEHKRYTKEELNIEEQHVARMKIYYLESVINFGKHKGKTLFHLIRDDPEHILWCIQELGHFVIENVCFLLPPLRFYLGLNKNSLIINGAKYLAFLEYRSKVEEEEEEMPDPLYSDKQLYWYEHWDESTFFDGFDGDIDSYEHYKDYS